MTNAIILVGTIAAATTFLIAPLIRRLLLRAALLDVPNHRSSHSSPTPRGGGIACMLGATAAIFTAQLTGQTIVWGAIVSTAAVGLLGLLDDIFALPAFVRLVSQIVVGACFGAAIGGPFWIFAGAITVPLFVNTMNFMDGIDGLSAIVSSSWGILVIALAFEANTAGLAVLGAIATGTSVGFLPWNAPRAKLFLGDVGSYFLGALTATSILYGASVNISPILLSAPLAILLLDVCATLARRIIRGAKLFEAHRDHTYQQLVHQTGLTHTTTALLVGALSLLNGIAVITLPAWIAGPTTVSIFVLYLITPRIAASAHYRLDGPRPAESSLHDQLGDKWHGKK